MEDYKAASYRQVYIQSSAVTLINNENIIFESFKIAQIFNNYFESAIRKFETIECKASSDVDVNTNYTGIPGLWTMDAILRKIGFGY